MTIFSKTSKVRKILKSGTAGIQKANWFWYLVPDPSTWNRAISRFITKYKQGQQNRLDFSIGYEGDYFSPFPWPNATQYNYEHRESRSYLSERIALLEIQLAVQITSQHFSTSRTVSLETFTKEGYYIFIEKISWLYSILKIVQTPHLLTNCKECKYVRFLICDDKDLDRISKSLWCSKRRIFMPHEHKVRQPRWS